MIIFSINGAKINSLEDVAAFEEGCAEAELQLIPSSWQGQHDAAIKLQRAWRWSNAATGFEALIQ